MALRLPLAIVALPAAAVTAVLAVLLAGESAGTRPDEWLLATLATGVSEPVGYVIAWVIGTVGDPIVAGPLMLALATVGAVARRPRLAALALAGPALTGVVTTLLKPVVGRTIHGDHLSFPSGHTAQLTCTAIIVALLLVDLRGFSSPSATALVLGSALVGGLAMSSSQTASSVHYASDTLGGFCVALVVVPSTALLIDAVADRRA